MTNRRPGAARRRQAGLGLVDIMVGMAIGMLAVVIIMQMFLLSDKQTRTTMGGADAQSGGAIALHGLERDLSQAGYGFASEQLLGCRLTWQLPSGAAIATPVPLAPVVINPAAGVIPAGDANTDTLLVIYGNTEDQPQGNAISAQAGQSYTVQMPASFTVGDRVVATPGGCGGSGILELDRVTAAPPSTTTSITVAAGAAGNLLFNLGRTPRILAYAVRGGNLTVCDYLQDDCGQGASKGNDAVWVPVAGNIVSLRALYGRDTSNPMDGVVEAYDQDTPTQADRANWARILSLRLALVARSAEYESRIGATSGQRECDPVTPGAPQWDGNAAAPIDLAADADWQCYRYRTFQTVVPMRNVIWMGEQ